MQVILVDTKLYEVLESIAKSYNITMEELLQRKAEEDPYYQEAVAKYEADLFKYC